jgi:hypothetical protein
LLLSLVSIFHFDQAQVAALVAPPPPPSLPKPATWIVPSNFVVSKAKSTTYQFKAECVLNAWLLRISLRSRRTTLLEVISLSMKLTLPDDVITTAMKQIDDGELRAPKHGAVEKTDRRLNMMDLLYQRRPPTKFNFARCWRGDSSPQGAAISS